MYEEDPEFPLMVFFIAGCWSLGRGALTTAQVLDQVRALLRRGVVTPLTELVVIVHAERLPERHEVQDLFNGRVVLTDAGPLTPTRMPLHPLDIISTGATIEPWACWIGSEGVTTRSGRRKFNARDSDMSPSASADDVFDNRPPLDQQVDPVTGLAYATARTGWDAWAVAAVFVYHADGLGRHPDGNTGPRVPDVAMREVAARLREGLAPSMVYRLGRWDAFMIEIEQPLDKARARALATRITALVDRPDSGLGVATGSWIGIALRRANASEDRLSERAGYAAWSAHRYHDNPSIRL